MKQIKLSDDDRKDIQRAANAVLQMCDWSLFPEGREYWDKIYESLSERAHHGTTDGKPWVEPELTDEDAKQRPWVMCRDAHDQRWRGPYVLVCKTNEKYGFAAAFSDFSELTSWDYCRLATPEEIEDANADR
jgi:hypothetical protein